MLYIKIINGQEKISECRTIKTENGWISNPTHEQILAAGWSVYEPPTPVVEPQQEPDMYDIINAVKTMLQSQASELSDEEALGVAALYPTWNSKLGQQVNAGDRVWYDSKLYKVIQSHTVQSDWTPDISASLFTEVTVLEWPEFVQPTGAHDAYMTGDQVTFNGQHYVSLIDNNIYSPEAYPQGWQLQ